MVNDPFSVRIDKVLAPIFERLNYLPAFATWRAGEKKPSLNTGLHGGPARPGYPYATYPAFAEYCEAAARGEVIQVVRVVGAKLEFEGRKGITLSTPERTHFINRGDTLSELLARNYPRGTWRRYQLCLLWQRRYHLHTKWVINLALE